MQVLVYEFATGGGLYHWPGEPDAAECLLREGSAMVRAVAEDFSQLDAVEVIVLRDARLDRSWLPECRHVLVPGPDEELAALRAVAAQSDWTLLIAPECEGMLLQRCRHVERAGGRLLSPSSRLVAWASDKNATSGRWRSLGLRVPRWCCVSSRRDPPKHFPFPAVLKPRDGAGSIGVRRVACVDELHGALGERPSARLEAFCEGLPASVAMLLGPSGYLLLPPCRQLLSDDGHMTYLGGELLEQSDLQRRAVDLAAQVGADLIGETGYVGMDLVLGSDPTGRADTAIELNPRLTTSYVGLRAATGQSLVRLMLEVASGRIPGVISSAGSVRFDSAGRVEVIGDDCRSTNVRP